MADTMYQPTERRPIASRERRVFQLLASWLTRRGMSPNLISILGMLAAMGSGVALWATDRWPEAARLFLVLAAALVQLRLVANLLDGMVAIASGKASRVGELYNECPDRISDSAVLIGGGYSSGGDLTLGFLAACVALLVAYVRVLGKACGAPNDFCGPMAKQQRMFVMTVVPLYLALTPAGWQPSWTVADRPWGLMAAALLLIIILGLVTFVRRLIRIGRALSSPECPTTSKP